MLGESGKDSDTSQHDILPVTIHPEDAKDKVFTAILKALLKMGNKPSSPKELANVIIQSDYATLGGATPFATVSSRISQHFKRAAQHNPPRPPLLAKHVDALRSRKIHYSLAANASSSPSSCPSSPTPCQKGKPQQRQSQRKRKRMPKELPSKEEKMARKRTCSSSLAKNSVDALPTQPAGQTKNKRLRIPKYDDLYVYENRKPTSRKKETKSASSLSSTSPTRFPLTKRSKILSPPSPSPPSSPSSQASSSRGSVMKTASSALDNEGESDTGAYSDYYEEMLQESVTHFDGKPTFTEKPPLLEQHTSDDHHSKRPVSPQPQPRQQQQQQQQQQQHDTDNLIWQSPSYAHFHSDFDPVYLPDASTVHHIPFAIDTPESVPISELDTYFTNEAVCNPTTSASSCSSDSSSARTNHNVFTAIKNIPSAKHISSSATATTATSSSTSPISSISSITASSSSSPSPPPASASQSVVLSSPSLSTSLYMHSNSVSDNEENSLIPANNTKYNKTIARQRRHSWPILYHQSNFLACDNQGETSNELTPKLDNKADALNLEITALKERVNESGAKRIVTQTIQSKPDDCQQTVTLFNPSARDEDESNMFIQYDDDDTDAGNDALMSHFSSNASSLGASDSSPLSVASLTELLELVQDERLDFPSLQCIINTTPRLRHLAPTAELVRSLATYLRQKTSIRESQEEKNNDDEGEEEGISSQSLTFSASPTSSLSAKESMQTQPNADIETILTRFPVLKLLLDYQRQSRINKADGQLIFRLSSEVIRTTTSTNPTMYITVIDNVPVCVASLACTPILMRRLDYGYVNGTSLLIAGGIDKESERSVIFSLEKDRIRIRRRKSGLYGTWIPLRRAQELAATCSIEHRLGPFLDDNIEAYFPSPLPISINKRNPVHATTSKRQHASSSWGTNASSNQSSCASSSCSSSSSALDDNIQQVHLHSILRDTTSATATATTLINERHDAHVTELLVSSPMSPQKFKAPLLGNFSLAGKEYRLVSVVDNATNSPSSATELPTTEGREKYTDGKSEGGISDYGDSEDDDEDTDTDSDVEEVRMQLKRTRDAAINAISNDTDLDNMVSVKYKLQSAHMIRPAPARALENGNTDTHSLNKHQNSPKLLSINKKQSISPFGIRSSTGSPARKFETSGIRKSASWNGSLAPHSYHPRSLGFVSGEKLKSSVARRSRRASKPRKCSASSLSSTPSQMAVAASSLPPLIMQRNMLDSLQELKSSTAYPPIAPLPEVSLFPPSLPAMTTTTTADNVTTSSQAQVNRVIRHSPRAAYGGHLGKAAPVLPPLREDGESTEEIDIGGSDFDDDLR